MPPALHPSARSDIETHILPDGSCLLFDPVASAGHVLDVVGALTWDYCDGARTPSEIAGEIAALLPQNAQLREEVLHLLDEFAERGLLSVAPQNSQG
jgi:Coenzyme PQQ synthesis protein D (PqqD)